jgi:hypothetical protein
MTHQQAPVHCDHEPQIIVVKQGCDIRLVTEGDLAQATCVYITAAHNGKISITGGASIVEVIEGGGMLGKFDTRPRPPAPEHNELAERECAINNCMRKDWLQRHDAAIATKAVEEYKKQIEPICDSCPHCDLLDHCPLESSTSTRQDPKFDSTDLLLLANDEWKRRQERRHLHDMQAWTSGFINGFLTDKLWARKQLDKIRSATVIREKLK